ncbi:hypothetical protein phiCTP1_gp30 [Clostridium phage phiCTP1]|uniref:hypothetical protein n=1 Tax=Clostridium phage phiCTP1 TaxID=871584 RepID=UPI0001E0782C|nr:hypothetical protein phiCTP1_gp30 [Clostridium phage phiCTP1]ADL40331.1 hypothetical phage protein [Clostridium phage phiCTP1]WMU07962.1 hypothetical protein vBCtySFA88_00030 [Clostridium phage vB_CtyS-FA88]
MNEQLAIILALVLGVIAVSIWVVPILKKKNIDIEKLATKAESVISASDPLIDLAKEIPAINKGATIIETIKNGALVGAKTAEQLGGIGSLTTNDEKFKSAQSTVYALLAELKITPTDNQKKLIDDYIQAAVYDLPKTNK